MLLAYSAAATAARAQSREPTPDELKAARELFQDAYRDEQGQRFAQALDKFQRVASVKESTSVRYRIAAVLASLGRLRESRDAYRALAASRGSLPANEQEIADSAVERAQGLGRRIPRLVVQLQENPPEGARVMIDGAPIPASTTPRPFELDPGEHVVQASAPTAQAYETKVDLQEGSEVAVTVVLPLRIAKVRPLMAPPPSTEPDLPPQGRSTLAIVALGAGGVLLVTGIVLLAVREGDIASLDKACAPTCPASNRSALESKRDQAQLLGPLGIGLSVAGLVAAGAGAYLFFRSSPVRVAPAPVRGGAVLGMGGAF